MNENHAKLMPSPEWAAHIQDEVLPQATAGVELGTDLLELGPGPGAATDSGRAQPDLHRTQGWLGLTGQGPPEDEPRR